MPDWLEVTVRTLVAVVVIFIITKMLGKRQVSQLSFFEYITGITIGSLVAYVSLEMDASWYLGIIAMLVWALVALGMEYGQLKSKRFRNWVDGKATVLIEDGKILEENLKKERITGDELLEQLRMKNAFRVSDVEFAVMEPAGEVSVYLKKKNQPVTNHDMGIPVPNEQAPQAVIMDGEILYTSLKGLGLSRTWLLSELDRLNHSLDEVFLAEVDSNGQLHLDLYDDQMKETQTQSGPHLLATLKKCEADMKMFSLSTGNDQAKAMYDQCAQQLQKVIEEVEPILRS